MHLVIGTSGHIDHGKTTLVKALTGVDADRWAEEKQRGITIDIGFAHLQDEAGNTLAFVDVPGHERFVHNMLAGAAGMDAVLMVIAADEGVMPQTREHLYICDLLGIEQGVIALTRSDVVDPELMELAEEDVRDAVAGTFLAEAPIVRVSGLTGEGLPALKAALAELTAGFKGRDAHLPFRFPVDRAFSVKGFGTVVTGTVVAGALEKDATVLQYPRGRELRVRGMQVHGQAAEHVEAGQRAALNLAGVATDEIERGDQLAAPGSLLTSHMLNVELRLVPDAPRDLTQRTRIRLHLGTQEVMGRIVLLEDEAFQPGTTQMIQMRLEQPVGARHGDRFIIRNYSPIYTLGGGRVIDPAPSKSRRIRKALAERLATLATGEPEALVEQVIYLQATRGVRATEAGVRTGLSESRFQKAVQQLASQGTVFLLDPDAKKYVHQDAVARLGRFVARVLGEHHQRHPERAGMTRAELAGKLSLIFTEKEVGRLLGRLVKDGTIAQTDQAFHLPGHAQEVPGQEAEVMDRLLATLRTGGVQPQRRTLLLEACGVDEKTGGRVLNMAVHAGKLVRVKEDLYYPPDVLDGIRERLRAHLQEQGEITVVDFKDLLGLTRKHAVDLLEHFDDERLTLRVENHRVLRSA